jgi:Tol biopolymer transport system component
VRLSTGDKLGPYEILAPIGAGGMGEVYRARDSRLGREVAVKVSAERFSERFEREARAVAALNHPNICTLHDVGPDYLVMELVEGESPRGPMPLADALKIARQIVEALQAAHDRGIVHRDLKPANIRIKSDGAVKVLDFGLAKILTGAADGSSGLERDDLTHSPTLAMGATHAGVILGTAAYMAPEQARGKVVDKRADIWAFGVVLYELLTGRQAFDGEDVSTILAAVIQREPRWDGVPAEVKRLLESCLEKDPRIRLRDIGDVWKLLDDGPTAGTPRQSRAGNAGWIAAAVLAIVAAIALWAPWRRAARPADRPLVRLEAELGPDVALVPLVTPTPSGLAISPDGTRLVYVASVAGGPQKLVMRRLDQPRATEFAGTEGALGPFFSPDGQWLAFFDGRRLNKISVDGGAAVALGEQRLVAGGSWGDDGNLIVGSGLTKGLLRIPSGGGTEATITKLADGESFHGFPQILPSAGKAVLFTVYHTPPGVQNATIEIVSPADGRRKTVARGGTSARYFPSGHLVYTNKATMFAVPFDLDSLETRGTATPILDDIAFDTAAGIAQFDVSRDGTLVYRRTSGSGDALLTTLRWLDATGKQEPLPARPGAYFIARLSHDGKRLAVLMREREGTPIRDVWIYDIERDTMRRLTFGAAAYQSPVWSPDGRYVVTGSVGEGIFWSRADGSGQPEQLLSSKSIQFPSSFTADGKRLAYSEVEGSTQLWTVAVDDAGGRLKAGKPERYLSTQFSDSDPMFSPDGRWLAYVSNESGRPEVYVRPFPAPASGQGGKSQISNNGGTLPIWSRGGRELLYQAGDQIMAVSYTVNGDAFVAGKPRVWVAKLGGATGFDLAPDGKRLVVLTPGAGTDAPKQDHTVVFMQNFFDELRRRVPTSN